MELHAKAKGMLGELVVAKDLISKGHAVFAEMGDLAKTDLVAIVRDCPIKVQVKTCYAKNGKALLDSRKAGPNYRFRYSESDVDVFALYVVDRDMVLYISCKELLQQLAQTTFRLDRAKNGNEKNIRYARDYLSFEKALRDYTPRTLPANVAGQDIVQTTTCENKANES